MNLLRVVAVSMVSVAMAAGAVACAANDAGSGGASGGSYKVALIADQSGAGSAVGQSTVNGFNVYIKSLNDRGGVNGKKVDVQTIDTHYTADGWQAAARQAVQGEPDTVVFGGSSSGIATMAPIFEQAGNTPVLAAAGGPSPSPAWFYGITTSPPQLNHAFVEQAKSMLGGSLQGKKVLLEGVNVAFVDSAWKTLIPALQKEGAIVSTERVTIGVTSFDAQAAKIAKDPPDVTMSLDIEADTVVVFQAMKAAGIKSPFLASEADATDAMFNRLAADNYYAARTEQVKPGSDFDTTAKKYGIDITGPQAPQGWVLGSVVEATLKKCGADCGSSKFLDTLGGLGELTVPGDVLYGPLYFDKSVHTGITKTVFAHYDPASKSIVPGGAAIDIKGIQ